MTYFFYFLSFFLALYFNTLVLVRLLSSLLSVFLSKSQLKVLHSLSGSTKDKQILSLIFTSTYLLTLFSQLQKRLDTFAVCLDL